MSSGTENIERTPQKYCKLHTKQEIKAFCKNDLYSICFKCLLGEHRNHEVVMLEDLTIDDLKDKVTDFHDKVDEQIQKLGQINERVLSVKENYDKKFEGLFNKFKDIENKFLNGYYEDMILGEIKSSMEKQKDIVKRVESVIESLDGI